MVNEARQTICNVFTKHLFSEHFTSNFEQSLIIFPDLSTYMSKWVDGLFFLIVVQRAVSKDYAMSLVFVKELRLEPVLPR